MRVTRIPVIASALCWCAITAHAQEAPPAAAPADQPAAASVEASIADYYAELEQMGLIDVETGTKQTLTRELAAAEKLLRQGAALDAATALYAIVESPRFEPFADFIEYQNAEYYLAVALVNAGAYESALTYLARAIKRGPSSMYFAPAHRKAIDVAIETRDYQGVLQTLERIKLDEPITPEASGERAYIRARHAYVTGDFMAAEGQLASINRKSRLFSSALYLRAVIRARQGKFSGAAEALCEVADTKDDEQFTFVIDNRYYTVKDLARLGLGRIAHEQREYDDAYYHYFQIPEDSDRLPEALFEAGWSMYQKRDLDPARELIDEFSRNFPTSPLMPEARLLAGYIELADCKFDAAQSYYDELVKELDPVVKEIEQIRAAPERRTVLFERALKRWRAERLDPNKRLDIKADTSADKVLGLLRLDPKFIRLNDAIVGLRRAAGDAPHVLREWRRLGKRAGKTSVGAIAEEQTVEQLDAADMSALVEDIRTLRDDVSRARSELRRGLRENTLPQEAADEERARLDELSRKLDALEARAARAAEQQDAAAEASSAPGLRPMIRADLTRARQLNDASRALKQRLEAAATRLAENALERLYRDTRRVLDKAKLGKIDAVIGQKRKLDIEVQDLAQGRWPAELKGRLWEEGLIGDDEEFWPFEGEFWADEYEGWR